MRSGMRILAACALTGLTLSVSAADDGFFSRNRFSFDNPARRTVEYFSKGGASDEPAAQPSAPPADRPPTRSTRHQDAPTGPLGAMTPAESPLPGVKNYHKALFGTERPSRTGGIETQTAQRPAPSAGPTRSPFGGFEPPTAAPQNDIGRATENPFAAQPMGAPSQDLIAAEYRRRPETVQRPSIEQVRATEDNISPFATSQPPMAAAAAPAATPPLQQDEENPFAAFERVRKERLAAPSQPAPRTEPLTAKPRAAVARSAGPVLNGSAERQTAGMPKPSPSLTRSLSSETSISVAAPVVSQTPTVTATWVKRSEINVGQPCECDLVVRNTGRVAAKDVVVEAWFPEFVRLTSVTPTPAVATDHLAWNFTSLAAGEEQTIHINMIPSRRGDLATKAIVRFSNTASNVFTVEEPLLDLQIKGPSDVLLGDPASQILMVSNPGTGLASNVVVEATVPRGLEHPRGERLMLEIGSLNPGETRQVRLALATVEGGQHRLQVVARADSGLHQQLEAEITVVAPSVSIVADGPSFRYIGRNSTYTLTVKNDGTVASNNVRVTHRVPPGFKFLRADRGGTFESATQCVNWFVGRLDAGQSLALHVEFDPSQPGSHVHEIEAITDQGARAEARVETQVEGTASLVLEIVDLNDPVEVGVETAYEVRVRNNGTAAAQGVSVACELEPGVELLNVKGPTQSGVEGGQLVFQPLPSLEPGKTALYRVHVRGTVSGNHRFRASLVSESIKEPLIFEELTKFYGE